MCINCNRVLLSKEEFLCLHCLLDKPVTNYHKLDENPLKRRLMAIETLHSTYAFMTFNKGGMAQKILHQLKYRGVQELGVAVGRWFAHHIKNDIDEMFDVIIPIPLHRAKLKRRGFNQSETIASGMSGILEVSYESRLLLRHVNTNTQTKKQKLDRLITVEDIFAAAQYEDISGKHVLLVDDVITTGATIVSAAAALSRAGAGHVSVACVATGIK